MSLPIDAGLAEPAWSLAISLQESTTVSLSKAFFSKAISSKAFSLSKPFRLPLRLETLHLVSLHLESLCLKSLSLKSLQTEKASLR